MSPCTTGEVEMADGIPWREVIAPSGVPHGIRNDGGARLVVSAILAPPILLYPSL